MSWLDSLTVDGASILAWRKLAGLGSPPPRQDVRDHARRHGSIDRTTYYEPRLIEISDAVLQGDSGSVWDALDALKASMALGSDHVLRFRRTGRAFDERVTCRVASELKAELDYASQGVVLWSVALLCADPRLYSDTLSVASYAPVSGAAGGLSFPLTFPLVFAAGSDSNLLQVSNGGTFPTPPTWVISGPAVNPQVVNQTTGDAIITSGLTLLAGDVATIDVAARQVLIGGTSRPDVIDSSSTTWGELAPGVNVIRLQGGGFDTASGTSLAVQYRDARI